MRDPARIERILDLLGAEWHKNPDQRLGQLLENALIKDGSLKVDHHGHQRGHCLFHLEDDVIELALGGESHPLFVGQNPWDHMGEEIRKVTSPVCLCGLDKDTTGLGVRTLTPCPKHDQKN